MSSLSLFRRSEDAVAFPAGKVVFEAGEAGESMYVVLEGEVSILIGQTVIEDVAPGSFFGEMALIDQGERSATAMAKTDCRLVPVNKRRFQFLVQEHPYFALEVMETLAKRLRRMDRKMSSGV